MCVTSIPEERHPESVNLCVCVCDRTLRRQKNEERVSFVSCSVSVVLPTYDFITTEEEFFFF